LQFPTGQIYNLVIRNASGSIVYNWAADKLFPAVVQRVTLGRREFFIDGALPNVAPGKYSAEAWLLTPDFPEKAFLARTTLEVVRQ
jgi:hypothetical protein